MKIFIGLLFAFLIYFILERIYAKNWKKGLSAEICFLYETAVEGDENAILLTVTNRKFLPLPMLGISFYTHKNILPNGGENTSRSDKNYRADIFTLPPYRKITRRLPFVCSRRGFYTIEDIRATASDPLMALRLATDFQSYTSLLVYPKGVNVEKIGLPFSKIMGIVISERFSYEDPFEFRTIRQYQSFDSIKSINWKASAKTGELMVNAHNYTVEQEAAILLCLDCKTAIIDDDLREEAIQLASSIARLLTEQGVPISLYSNGLDMVTHEEIHAPRGLGKNHCMTVCEKLARADLSLECENFCHILVRIAKKTGSKAIPILISPPQGKDFLREFTANYPRHSVWLITHRPDDPPKECGSNDHIIIPWEVPY